MNTEELYKLINESEWKHVQVTEMSNHLEYSEMFALWNDEVSYIVYGVRDDRYPNNVKISVIRGRPMSEVYDDISEVDIDWTNINIMPLADMIKDEKNKWNEFLKRNK